MTRQQRARELIGLIRSEDGLGEIVDIYCRECEPLEADDTLPPDSQMIAAILNAEFPPRSAAFLART